MASKAEGPQVHLLESNEGLLLRDHATYAPLFRKFGISCCRTVDSHSEICYTLRKSALPPPSRRSVDDLVVKEKPTANYMKEDTLQTPDLVKALAAAREKRHMPSGIERKIWIEATNWVLEGEKKRINIDYTKEERNGSPVYVELVDGKPPKVSRTHGWLIYLMYRDFGTPPKKFTPYLTICTPYMYNKYECIFGLAGSVGGQAERDYIEKTFNAVPFQVPLFLSTCRDSAKTAARNKGVMVERSREAMLRRVCDLTIENYTKVPILVITQGEVNDEFDQVHAALSKRLESERMRSGFEFDAHSLMTLTERDREGNLLDWRWQGVIEDSTKRTGTGEAAHFHITLTDAFGGRGHDFNCNDEFANANGGMLVIATSVPDTRVWVQWKGRTARQDRPGQFFVVLSADDNMFVRHSGLLSELQERSEEGKIEHILALQESCYWRTSLTSSRAPLPSLCPSPTLSLSLQDRNIHATLSHYEREQAKGAWLNELCDKYYVLHQRRSAEWPSASHKSTDTKLRDLLSAGFSTGEDIRSKASESLQLQLDGPPMRWGLTPASKFVLQSDRQRVAVTFLVDRKYDSSVGTVVSAVQGVYEEQLEADDLVGYWGLGTGWIFEMARKDQKGEEMLSLIKGSAVQQGESLLYSDLEKVLAALASVDAAYSKWLVVVSDLVDEENKTEAESVRVVQKQLIPQIKSIPALNLVLIDASRIGLWKSELPMWPTWERNAKELTDAAQNTAGSRGYLIGADNPDAITEAFEQVAALMHSGGVADET
ncbi:MAG: hypothetical protein SGPRY_004857 [Prymnesium sp.]